jgi:hypothetical protein
MRWYWPEVTDVNAAEDAVHKGAGACFFIAGVTALVASISIYLKKPVLGIDGWSFVDAALFAISGWRMWRLSRPWAVFALALFLVEKVYALAMNPVPSGIVMSIVLILMLIGGVRGAFAHHRLKAIPAPESVSAAAGNAGSD